MQFAGLESTMGVGVIVGGVLLSVWGGFRRRIVTSMVGLLGIGLGSILVGLTPASAYLMAVVGMFVLGFALPITNGPLLAAVQAAVAELAVVLQVEAQGGDLSAQQVEGVG